MAAAAGPDGRLDPTGATAPTAAAAWHILPARCHSGRLLAAAAVVATAFYSVSAATGTDRGIRSSPTPTTGTAAARRSGIHTHPWYYYFELLFAYRPARGFFWTEGLIVGLAAVGAIYSISSLRERERGGSEAASARSPTGGREKRFAAGP